MHADGLLADWAKHYLRGGPVRMRAIVVCVGEVVLAIGFTTSVALERKEVQLVAMLDAAMGCPRYVEFHGTGACGAR